jgi:transcriptional regulator with XRE-family HTH domain
MNLDGRGGVLGESSGQSRFVHDVIAGVIHAVDANSKRLAHFRRFMTVAFIATAIEGVSTMNRHSVQRQRIGPAVRRMRRSRGLTLDALADQAGVSPSHLSRLERSQTLPSFPVLAKIADALDVDVNEFVRLEQDVAQMDEELSRFVDYLALDDDAYRELLDLSIETRRELVERMERVATLMPTPPDIQDQVVRAISSGRDDAPFSATSTLIERSGLDPVCLPRMLLVMDLLYGRRSMLIARPSLLPILPGEDLLEAYRWAFPQTPIDPVAAEWWARGVEEIGPSGSNGRSLRAIVTDQALESPLGPAIARSLLAAPARMEPVELALTARSLGGISVLTVAGGYGVLEQLPTRRGTRGTRRVAIWLSGTTHVGPCEEVVERLWQALTTEERDPARVRSRLEQIAAQSS